METTNKIYNQDTQAKLKLDKTIANMLASDQTRLSGHLLVIIAFKIFGAKLLQCPGASFQEVLRHLDAPQTSYLEQSSSKQPGFSFNLWRLQASCEGAPASRAGLPSSPQTHTRSI